MLPGNQESIQWNWKTIEISFVDRTGYGRWIHSMELKVPAVYRGAGLAPELESIQWNWKVRVYYPYPYQPPPPQNPFNGIERKHQNRYNVDSLGIHSMELKDGGRAETPCEIFTESIQWNWKSAPQSAEGEEKEVSQRIHSMELKAMLSIHRGSKVDS